MINLNSIIQNIFKNTSINKRSTLIIHSSFKNLSHQGVSADNFIKCLIDYFSDGTLLMPTMTWRTVTPINNIFNQKKHHLILEY